MSLMQSKEEKHFIHNHFTFLVKYHKDANTDLARIVAFEVKPYRCNIHPSFDITESMLWCSLSFKLL